MAIMISKGRKDAERIERSNFEHEGDLQKYIHENPESLPLYDIEADIHLLIVAREFPTGSGPIDALGIDQNGEIYVVETKLFKNPDKRLVVAQVLDYGASLWHSYSNFIEFCSIIESKVSETFNMSFAQKVRDFFGIEEEEVTVLLDNMRDNLSDGKFRFVVLMDRLQDKLKDLIVFLNQNCRFDVFGVELEYYKYQEYEIMIPRLFGSKVKKTIGTPTARKKREKWDESRFFEAVENNFEDSDQVDAFKKLYEFSKEKADDIGWGTGLRQGSFNPKFYSISIRSPYSVFLNESGEGWVNINFGWLNDNAATQRCRDEFKTELEALNLVTIPDKYEEKFILIPMEQLATRTDEFTKIVDRLLSMQSLQVVGMKFP